MFLKGRSFGEKDGVFERPDFLKKGRGFFGKDGLLKTRVFGEKDGVLKGRSFLLTYHRYKSLTVFFLLTQT